MCVLKKASWLIIVTIPVVLSAGKLVQSDDCIQNRMRFRQLLDQPETFDSAVIAGLEDRDPLIRHYSLFRYFEQNGEKSFPRLLKMVKDPDSRVVKLLIDCAVWLQDPKSSQLLKAIADSATVAERRQEASQKFDFRFYRDNKRLRDNPAHDYEITVVKTIELPQEGWRFRVDPMKDGHNQGWYGSNFNDSSWKKVRMGYWGMQGYQGYEGVAWHRLKFSMLPKIKCNAVELAFKEGVNELAWIWLNGIYIGQKDVEKNSRNKPFWLDITREIKWGNENTLVIRVEGNAENGGVGTPVQIEILK